MYQTSDLNPLNANLRDRLLTEGKMRWLDVGCGGNFEPGFIYLDTFPEGILNPELKPHYVRLDILNASESELLRLSKFDLVRMQHTFEHFSYEEGQRVLANCARLLKQGGLILITVPDLRVHIQKYLNDEYKSWPGFKSWANRRVPFDAPSSFYFSVFTFSMPYENHKWCYDAEGLMYQLRLCGHFEQIRELKFSEPLASYPFTHNRPEEDLCLIGVKR